MSRSNHTQPEGAGQPPSDDDWLNEAATWWSQALSKAGAGFRARMDANAREAMNGEQERVNADLFKQHVVADLRAIISGYACLVRLEMSSYEDAYANCRLYANRRGSRGLSKQHLLELHAWIQDELGKAIGTEG